MFSCSYVLSHTFYYIVWVDIVSDLFVYDITALEVLLCSTLLSCYLNSLDSISGMRLKFCLPIFVNKLISEVLRDTLFL
jgi:hypothetical protein